MSGRDAEILILGGGASGMMAAIAAAEYCSEIGAQKNIAILEHNDLLGKKIYATGNGRCNYTNEKMDPSFFRGDSGKIFRVLDRFGERETLDFFRRIGVYPRFRDGYAYPASMQAKAVAQALENRVRQLGIRVLTGIRVRDICPDKEKKGGFVLDTDRGKIRGRRLIAATGLLASPKLGSDGSSMDLFKRLGHRFSPVVPALCGFFASGMDSKTAVGVRARGRIRLLVGEEKVAEDLGEIQFTDYGISGIPVFQVSRYASLAIREKKKVKAEIDFFPELSREQLSGDLEKLIRRGPGIGGYVNEKLFPSFCLQMGLDRRTDFSVLRPDQAGDLAAAIKACRVVLEKPRGYEQAQVCAGGIRDDQVEDERLESNLCSGLFFCGEILNVDGVCGGYNLQWAWSSGHVAGVSAAKSLLKS